MPTLQALQLIYNWFMSDWSHVIVAMSAIAAVTPTPAPGTIWAKLYRVVDTLALNVLHAKSNGVAPAAIAAQVATLLQAQLQAKLAAEPAPPVLTDVLQPALQPFPQAVQVPVAPTPVSVNPAQPAK